MSSRHGICYALKATLSYKQFYLFDSENRDDKGGNMFTADYKSLILSFNEFHEVSGKEEMPQYGEFCLLELKTGDYTAGEWHPEDYRRKKSTSGKFIDLSCS